MSEVQGVSKSDEEKRFSKQIVGKVVITKSGKRFGEVGDLIFETNSGELIHIVLKNPTQYAHRLDLEKSKEGKLMVPCSSIEALGDFVVIAEEDISLA
jgi:sporulation protein YlmC with PRC-barrel domain